MASAFAPFPARTMPFAALAKPVEYGTGLIVSARGDIVTDRNVTDGCKVIVAAGLGNAERVAEDKSARPGAAARLRPAQAAGAAAAAREREAPRR